MVVSLDEGYSGLLATHVDLFIHMPLVIISPLSPLLIPSQIRHHHFFSPKGQRPSHFISPAKSTFHPRPLSPTLPMPLPMPYTATAFLFSVTSTYRALSLPSPPPLPPRPLSLPPTHHYIADPCPSLFCSPSFASSRCCCPLAPLSALIVTLTITTSRPLSPTLPSPPHR
jgi:hypothetical protein